MMWSSILKLVLSLGILSSVNACVRLSVSNLLPTEDDGRIEICVEFTENITNAGSVMVTSNNELATAPDDFTALNFEQQLPAGHSEQICTGVEIQRDNRIENIETFIVNLTSSDILLCTEGREVQISIQDTSRLQVRFNQSTYTINEEDEAIQICIQTLPGFFVDRDISFNLMQIPNQGTVSLADARVSQTRTWITPDNFNDLHCSEVMISEDEIVEEDEYLLLTINSLDSIDLENSTKIIISDDDGATLRLLNQTVLNVEEGDIGTTGVDICIELDSSLMLDRDVVINCNTHIGTADTRDYEELIDVPLTILSGSSMGTQECKTVRVIGDDVIEGNEFFNVLLRTVNENDVLTETFIRIIITDDNDNIKDCGPLGILNGIVSVSPDTLEGAVATYSCITGYNLQGNSTRVCLDTGIWSNSMPECQIIDCEGLSNPENGNVFLQSSTFQSVATYTCDVGYDLSSGGMTFNRTCQENAMWSETEPVCNPLNCDQLPDIDNGNVSVSATTVGSQATYTCNPGYILVGRETRECETDTMWSDTPPSCEDLTPMIMPSTRGQAVVGQSVKAVVGQSVMITCMAPNISNLITVSNITWFNESNHIIASNTAMVSLELEFGTTQFTDAGTYTCVVEMTSSALLSGRISTNFTFNLDIIEPPITEDLEDSSNTELVIGVSVGGGVVLLIIIFFVGVLMLCLLCRKKKQNYKKYVLPYRMYMHANRNTSSENTPNDISLWENDLRQHVVDAVNILDQGQS